MAPRTPLRFRLRPPRSRKQIHRYWKRPWDEGNLPDSYVDETEAPRSRFLVSLAERYVAKDASVLEIGCNAGRNLHFLHEAGYRDLHGIEISHAAAEELERRYREMARSAAIEVGAAEEILPTMPDRAFGLVFTMAVLVHIHPDSAWMFEEIARVAGGVLITIEHEKGETESWRHFPRNYRKVFKRDYGFEQLDKVSFDPREIGLPRAYVARVFKRRS